MHTKTYEKMIIKCIKYILLRSKNHKNYIFLTAYLQQYNLAPKAKIRTDRYGLGGGSGGGGIPPKIFWVLKLRHRFIKLGCIFIILLCDLLYLTARMEC